MTETCIHTKYAVKIKAGITLKYNKHVLEPL